MSEWLTLLGCCMSPVLIFGAGVGVGYIVGANKLPFRVRIERMGGIEVDDGSLSETYL